MKRVLILYGWGGSDAPHWQAWLANELQTKGIAVSFPKLPNKEMPLFHEWKKTLLQELDSFKPDTVICHSLANLLWLRLCHENAITATYKHLILVAPPAPDRPIPELNSFFPLGLPKNIHAHTALLITSSNDPYLTQDEAATLASLLPVQHLSLLNAGHINSAGGYGPWPWLCEYILKQS